jgi:hypothetical protein
MYEYEMNTRIAHTLASSEPDWLRDREG